MSILNKKEFENELRHNLSKLSLSQLIDYCNENKIKTDSRQVSVMIDAAVSTIRDREFPSSKSDNKSKNRRNHNGM